ncbi:hypothetical protein ACQPZZ_32965 [Microbispora sp. CA-135349]|uniref:hypothetical protein n=1 Tax=Microbispora sp. CA-135349 TaxID=3239953 RepID=UPI003D9284E6
MALPKQEFPQFPAALSHLMMIPPHDALRLLERRAERLAETRAGLEASLAAQTGDLPRVTAIESEYLLALTATEERWLRSVVDDLREGRLTWPASDS